MAVVVIIAEFTLCTALEIIFLELWKKTEGLGIGWGRLYKDKVWGMDGPLSLTGHKRKLQTALKP